MTTHSTLDTHSLQIFFFFSFCFGADSSLDTRRTSSWFFVLRFCFSPIHIHYTAWGRSVELWYTLVLVLWGNFASELSRWPDEGRLMDLLRSKGRKEGKDRVGFWALLCLNRSGLSGMKY